MDKIKIVYGYNPLTLEYIGEVPAHLCPVTKLEYLMPANTTEDAPLACKVGFAQIRQDGEWVYIEDNRGKPIYNCQTGEQVGFMTELSAILPDGYTVLQPEESQVWDGSKWIDKPEPTEKDLAHAEIRRLESQITERRKREAILGTDNGWLAAQEALIQIERDKL